MYLFCSRLFNKISKAPRAASTSAVRRRAKTQKTSYSIVMNPHSYGTRPAILGAEVAPAGIFRMLSSESGTTAEEDQVDRILDAGAKRLFDSEEGREKIREGSYDIDETAKVMLEAAKEALDEREEAESADDSSKAKVRKNYFANFFSASPTFLFPRIFLIIRLLNNKIYYCRMLLRRSGVVARILARLRSE